MLTEQNTLVTGTMINKKDRDKKFGRMEHNMLDNMSPEKNMVLVNFNGLMDHNTKGNFKIIICKINIFIIFKVMVMALIYGQMVEFIKVNGKIIKWTDKENSSGLTVENI